MPSWLRKLLTAPAIALLIVYAAYAGLGMAAGRPPGTALVRGGAEALEAAFAFLRGELGVTAAVRGRPVPIADVLAQVFPRSLGLLAVSLGIATLLGIYLGALAALRRRWGWPMLLATTLGLSVPSFLAAVLLQWGAILLYKRTGWRWVPVGGFGWDRHLVLPALTLAARPLAQVARMTQLTLSQVLEEEYIRTARSKGLPFSWILRRHVLRNVLGPVLTTALLSLRFAISSLPVVETFFGWKGAGDALLLAVTRYDPRLTAALALAFGALLLAVEVLRDALPPLWDPRLRQAGRPSAHLEASFPWSLPSLASWVSRAPLPPLRPSPPEGRSQGEGGTSGGEGRPEGVRVEVDLETTFGDAARMGRRRRLHLLRHLAPLWIGLALAGLLLAVAVWGPAWAPNNPYQRIGISYKGGKFSAPPFPPNDRFPLGTDPLGRGILSFLLHGARRTLILALLATLARVGLGAFLGSLGGWFHGRWPDRLLQGLQAALAAFPTLLAAMLVVLAVGIRRGLLPFVVGLAVVGWEPIAGYVRDRVRTLKESPALEAAASLGVTAWEAIFRHIWRILLPELVALAALEVGGMMMLLGELGFVGVFVGGGSFSEVVVAGPAFHYSDVPEWASLLASVRQYARTAPWMTIPPSLAFFLTILAATALGEGLRRLVNRSGRWARRLTGRYALAGVLAFFLLVRLGLATTGAIAAYRDVPKGWSRERVAADLQVLLDPALEGRRVGTEGLWRAAEYAADRWAEAGVQPAGEGLSYVWTVRRDVLVPQNPRLSLDGQARTFGRDFGLVPIPYDLRGTAEGEIVAVKVGEVSRDRYGRLVGVQLEEYPGKVLLVPDLETAALLWSVKKEGILIVAPEDRPLDRYALLSPARGTLFSLIRIREVPPFPAFYLSRDLARQILGPDWEAFSREEVPPRTLRTWTTGHRARLSLEGSAQKKVEVPVLLGTIPGEDERLDEKMVVLAAPYDGLGVDWRGYLYPEPQAAAAAAALLELPRAWRDAGYKPRKTVLLALYPYWGVESGKRPALGPPDPETLKNVRATFRGSFELEAAVQILSFAGPGGRLEGYSGSLRLADTFEGAARAAGRPYRRTVRDLGAFRFEAQGMAGEAAPTLYLRWSTGKAWQGAPGPFDVEAVLDALDQGGPTLLLGTLIVAREEVYP